MAESEPSGAVLGLSALRALAAEQRADPACPCTALRCPGWESLSTGADVSFLRRVGRLAEVDPYNEATVEEYHPAGTRYASPDAPVALGHFPYNRCEAWQCVHCARAFLRYTEYGGYYVDHRIRVLDPVLLVDTTATQPKG